ncbi:MAG TPA: hypothetical protein VIY73_19940 [Polyangiaceae bacterium]
MNERPTVVEGLRRRVQRALSATEENVSTWAVGVLIERTADGEARLSGGSAPTTLGVLGSWRVR